MGVAFEFKIVSGKIQKRRVIKAKTNSIVSIVPFDAENKVTAGGGNRLDFESASKWRFSDGWCGYYDDGDYAIFSIRLIDTTPEEDEQYTAWLADGCTTTQQNIY